MKRYLYGLAMIMFLGSIVSVAQNDKYDPTRWEKEIGYFLEQDEESFPPEDAILFIGSSSIRMWELEKYFPELETINRGFGGSHMEDSLYYADKIAIPYKPRTIVVYAGDNDIAAGKEPKTVLNDYKAFVEKVREELPETKFVYIAIKPSLARWDKVEQMRQANQLIKAYSDQDPLLHYADIDTPMIGDDGKPRESLFLDDGLHLSHEGYVVWTNVLKPILMKQN